MLVHRYVYRRLQHAKQYWWPFKYCQTTKATSLSNDNLLHTIESIPQKIFKEKLKNSAKCLLLSVIQIISGQPQRGRTYSLHRGLRFDDGYLSVGYPWCLSPDFCREFCRRIRLLSLGSVEISVLCRFLDISVDFNRDFCRRLDRTDFRWDSCPEHSVSSISCTNFKQQFTFSYKLLVIYRLC